MLNTQEFTTPPKSITLTLEDGSETIFDCAGEESFVFLTQRECIVNGHFPTCLRLLHAAVSVILEQTEGGKETSH